MTPVDELYPTTWRVPMMTMDEFSQALAKVRLVCHQVLAAGWFVNLFAYVDGWGGRSPK